MQLIDPFFFLMFIKKKMSGENIKNSLFEIQVNLLDIQIMAKQSMLFFFCEAKKENTDELKKDIAILKKKRARLFKEKIEEMDYLQNRH